MAGVFTRPLMALFGPAHRRRGCPFLGTEREWLANVTRRANQFIHQFFPVQPLLKKYSDFPKPQITLITLAVPLLWRGVAQRHETRSEMRWTPGARWTGDCNWRTAKACGPDAPTLASSRRRAIFAGDGGKKARSPGRARYKPVCPKTRKAAYDRKLPKGVNRGNCKSRRQRHKLISPAVKERIDADNDCVRVMSDQKQETGDCWCHQGRR